MTDTLQEIWSSVQRNKLRTLATGFAVASGLFLLIVLLGAGNGIIHTLEKNSEGLALDAIQIWGGTTSKPHDGLKEGHNIQLDDRDRELVAHNFPREIQSTSVAVTQSGLTASVNSDYMSISIEGVYPRKAEVSSIQIIRGRFINETDLKERRKVVVISERNAKNLFKRGTNPLNALVRISGIYYRIIGIFKDNNMEGSTPFYAPYTTVQTIYGKGKLIDNLILKTTDALKTEEDHETFMEAYRKATGALHRFDPTDKRAIWIWNSASAAEEMNTAMNILQTSFWILGLLTLLSGVVGVSNIMLISVKERTHEFGIRKALGARPWNIIRMVMLESVLITAFFGYIGMVAGVAFTEYMDATVGNQTMDMGIVQQQYFIDPTVDLSICIQATFVIILAGALAGFFPARKAAKVKPIEALRAE